MITFLFIIVLVLGQNLFTEGKIDWGTTIANYIGIVLFVVLWIGYKMIKKTKVVPLTECDFNNRE